MPYPEPSAARQVIAYCTAVPAAFGVAGTLRYLLAPLRRRSAVGYSVARVGVIGIFYATFAAVMVGVAGPYVFAGVSRDGNWHTSPMDGRKILTLGLAIGVIGAVTLPLLARLKGRDDSEM